MKGLVLFRSYYGNTKQIAKVIAEQIAVLGHEASVHDLTHKLPDLTGVDFLVIGAPTRMAKVSRKATAALRQLRKKGFAGKPIAVFDTYGPVPADPQELAKVNRWLNPGAAGILQKVAKEEGMNVYARTLRCPVEGMSGPLAEGDLRNAAAFASEFVTAMVAPRR